MPQFSVGETILNGKYRIDRLLGEGAFGEVYLATHQNLKAQRALKVLRKEGASGVGSTVYGNARRRFLQESKLGAQLGAHPRIIQVMDFDEVEDLMVLALEYAAGGSLQKILEVLRKRGQLLPIADALRIAVQVADGLALLHKLDVVHRDLKPGNILFDKEGRAKVADFGLAQVPHGETRRQEKSMPEPHPGTPGYMSPEQATPPYDMLTPASDIYALGKVLFEMLTGRLQHLQPQGTRPSDLRPGVPAALDDLVQRMLAQNPQERPWNGSEAARLLRAVDLPRNVQAAPAAPRAAPPEPAAPAGLLECPICGSYKETKDTFRCKGCGRAQICLSHRDQSSYLCEDCARARKVRQEGDRLWIGLAQGVEMEFVRVPAGKFTMGSNDYDAEKPVHDVHLDEYWMGRYPVTNAQFHTYVAATQAQTTAETDGFGMVWNDTDWEAIDGADWRHPSGPASSLSGRENHPVVQVSWGDARAFCAWLSRESGQKIVLPTEAQWEKAVRGADGRTYPWGNAAPDPTRCNFNLNVKSTTLVGKYSPMGDSPYGCADMAGNVWEWCADWYDEGYYGKSPKTNPAGPATGEYRVLRGGSWDNVVYLLRSSDRGGNSPDGMYNYVGFRCARSLP